MTESLYEKGSYFALIFDSEGEKQGIMYGTDLETLELAIADIQETEEVDYVVLQVVSNPKNKVLH